MIEVLEYFTDLMPKQQEAKLLRREYGFNEKSNLRRERLKTAKKMGIENPEENIVSNRLTKMLAPDRC
jgi:hypothetical protein